MVRLAVTVDARLLWLRPVERASFYAPLTLRTDDRARKRQCRLLREVKMVGAIAIAMFVALVGFGGRYFGWSDPDGKVQLALATSFILGIIGGYKAKN
jgi:hypothetical protein